MNKMKNGYLRGGVIFILSLFTLPAQSSTDYLKGVTPFSSTTIIHALKEAYPGIITHAVFRNEDWILTVRGEPFQWAGGRLLPAGQNKGEGDFSPYPFYTYLPEYNPPLSILTMEQEKELDKLINQREAFPISRNPGFLKALYRITDEESAWNIMKTTYFLGHKVMIHRDLLEDLARIEEKINLLMLRDSQLRAFVQDIETLEGYNWRTIEGTKTLSHHSFGIAIDIIPKDYQGKEAYWRWSRAYFPQWYRLTWEKRFQPPLEFVKAFEEEGFVWGGKWFFYDSIHFEYRPEILLLNRMP